MITPRVSSRTAAKMLGVATSTLARWRCEGTGPLGWVRISRTLVAYPTSEVESFLEERNARLEGFNPFPEQRKEEAGNG